MSVPDATIRDAEDAIRRRFEADGFRGKLVYAATEVIETDRWWYIPFTWIGCAGFIVNKSDLYVNWLGSGCPLEHCFWGHDHGVFCDLVDFTFSPDTDLKLAASLLARFKHMHPNARGVLPNQPVPYRESEVAEALAGQFPIFCCHAVWQCILELRHASENERLRFTCELSKGCLPTEQPSDPFLSG